MTIPNLTGMNIITSLDKLLPFTDKYNIIIKRTTAPFKKNLDNNTECRVVRQKVFENNIEIIISYF